MNRGKSRGRPGFDQTLYVSAPRFIAVNSPACRRTTVTLSAPLTIGLASEATLHGFALCLRARAAAASFGRETSGS